jgi:hypothetical protein
MASMRYLARIITDTNERLEYSGALRAFRSFVRNEFDNPALINAGIGRSEGSYSIKAFVRPGYAEKFPTEVMGVPVNYIEVDPYQHLDRPLRKVG